MLRRRFSSYLPLAALVLAALLPTTPAASQTPAAGAATTRPSGGAALSPSDQADALYREGLELGKAKDWPRAYQKFLHAYQLKKSFDIASNLGAAEFNLKKYTDAAEHLRYGLSVYPPNGKPEAKKSVEEVFAKAKAEVGVLRLKVSPAGAEVKVNDRAVGASDNRDEVFVEVGDVRVEGGLKGYEPFSKTVTIPKGGAAEVEVTLKAATGAGPTASATVAPTGTVITPGPNMGLLVTGIGVTAASLGVGIGLMVASGGKLNEGKAQRDDLLKDPTAKAACDRPDPEPRCKPAALDEASLLGNVGVPMLVGGFVVGAATLVYGLVTRSKVQPPVKAGAVIHTTGGAVFIGGNW